MLQNDTIAKRFSMRIGEDMNLNIILEWKTDVLNAPAILASTFVVKSTITLGFLKKIYMKCISATLFHA
jgi:hypothetical protein